MPGAFEDGEIDHKRNVNACHNKGGGYDETATEARVSDIARGVAQNILVGAITAPEVTPAREIEAETPAVSA